MAPEARFIHGLSMTLQSRAPHDLALDAKETRMSYVLLKLRPLSSPASVTNLSLRLPKNSRYQASETAVPIKALSGRLYYLCMAIWL